MVLDLKVDWQLVQLISFVRSCDFGGNQSSLSHLSGHVTGGNWSSSSHLSGHVTLAFLLHQYMAQKYLIFITVSWFGLAVRR